MIDIIGKNINDESLKDLNLRVIEEDGKSYETTLDFIHNRINVAVVNGIITEVINFG